MTARERKNKGAWRIALLVALLLMAALVLMEQQLSQMMLDMAYARAYSIAVETVNRAILSVMDGLEYNDLVETSMDESGRVSMLRANTVKMNELAAKTALTAEGELASAENQYVEIPLASAFGVRFLSGFGPKLSVRIIPIGAVGTSFDTMFESAGINQTRHKIFLTLKTTVRLIIPTGSQLVEVLSSVPVAESIIVGEVPDSFVDVSDQEDMLNLIP